MAEHVFRYDEFAKHLAERGFVVTANDHLGHGRSASCEEELGYFGEKDGWASMVKDIGRLRKITAGKFGELPYFLLGHSMGSFLARTYALQGDAKGLSGLLLLGTGHIPQVAVKMGRQIASVEELRVGQKGRSKDAYQLVINALNSKVEQPETDIDWLTRDKAHIEQCMTDKRWGFMFTVRGYMDFFDGVEVLDHQSNLRRMDKSLPVIFLSGDGDPVGMYGAGVKRVVSDFIRANMQDISLRLYPEARHEILNEVNREEVLHDIDGWIESKIK
jgi:alpha-beta hydrolase superfamily lysophospholipase